MAKKKSAAADSAHGAAGTGAGTHGAADTVAAGEKIRAAAKKFAAGAAERRESLAKDFQAMLDGFVGVTYKSLEECQEFCIGVSTLALSTGLHLTFQGQPVMVDVGRPRPGFWNVRLRSKTEGPTYKSHVGSSVAFPKLGCKLRVLKIAAKTAS